MDSFDAAIFTPRDVPSDPVIYQDGTLGHLSVKELFQRSAIKKTLICLSDIRFHLKVSLGISLQFDLQPNQVQGVPSHLMFTYTLNKTLIK